MRSLQERTPRPARLAVTALPWALVLVAACEGTPDPRRPVPATSAAFVCDPGQTAPPVEPLTWKRIDALSNDLRRALALSESELCNEVDEIACVNVHQVALGGKKPFAQAQWTAVGAPLATTSSALDRLVWSACHNAAVRDAGTPRVFTDLPPAATTLDLSVAATSQAVDAQITTLYRRLLARDPEAAEVALVRELAQDPAGAARSAQAFDTLACFTIGTMTEMALF